MSRGKAMLVNGKCAVLKEHCQRVMEVLYINTGEKDFISKLLNMETSENWVANGEKGKRYVAKSMTGTL
jgi:hypothetical protein